MSHSGVITKISLIFLLMIASLALAKKDGKISASPGIQIVKFGYSKATKINEIKESAGTASQNLIGYSNLGYIKEGETKIPGIYKAVMCVTYKVTGPRKSIPVVIDMKTIHPPITNPRTLVTCITDTWTEKKVIGETYVRGYEFANEWEIVPGEWVFEFWHRDKKLASRKFAVFKP